MFFLKVTFKWYLQTDSVFIITATSNPKIHIPAIIRVMSRYLNRILTHAITDSTNNIKNSFELKDRLDNITLEQDDVMVSFDVVSIYERISKERVYASLKTRWALIAEHTDIMAQI